MLRLAAPGIVAAVLAVAPFLGKAFTVDDHVFLFSAVHATADPFHPLAFEMVVGDAPGRVGLSSGPVMAWLLVPSVLAGGSEPLAHGVQLAMLALAVLATVSLALRLGLGAPWASLAGLLLACTPAALGMAGTAMPDVPAMALGVAGLERLLAWRQERRPSQAILAALALALAPLARPHLVLLLGIGVLLLAGDFLARSSWRVGLAPWLPLVVAPLATAAMAVGVSDPHPAARGIVSATASVSTLFPVWPNATAFLVHWVLALPLAVPWVALRPGAVLRRWPAFALVAAAAALLVLGHEWPSIGIAAIAGVGAAVLVDVAADGWARRDPVQLALWLWTLVALAVVPYPHLPAKYLLASAPAAAILVAREASRATRRRALASMAATCALALALGVAILKADATFAGLGRRAAAELVAPNVAAGRRVWFAGHWGFQWYAERAGGRPLTVTPPFPAAGDLVVTSLACEPGETILRMLVQRYPRPTHLARIEDRRPGGRVMSPIAGAGFFSQAWGFLPWAWGDDPIDSFDLWRID